MVQFMLGMVLMLFGLVGGMLIWCAIARFSTGKTTTEPRKNPLFLIGVALGALSFLGILMII